MKTHRCKGIVVKVNETNVTLLSEDGTFKNVPRSPSDVPQIGETYTYHRSNRKSFSGINKCISFVSLCLIAIIGLYMSSHIHTDPSYLFAVDINPSLEIYTNEELIVTKIKHLNEDGKVVVDSLNHEKNQQIDIILQQIITIASKNKYLTKNEKGLVSLTVIPLNGDSQIEKLQVRETIKESLASNAVSAKVAIKKGDKKLINKSRDVNLSVNKYLFYQELKKKDFDISIDEIRENSIPRIAKKVGHSKSKDEHDLQEKNKHKNRNNDNKDKEKKSSDNKITRPNSQHVNKQKNNQKNLNMDKKNKQHRNNENDKQHHNNKANLEQQQRKTLNNHIQPHNKKDNIDNENDEREVHRQIDNMNESNGDKKQNDRNDKNRKNTKNIYERDVEKPKDNRHEKRSDR